MTVNDTPSRCAYRWPLLDPSEEDKAHNVTHWCRFEAAHGSRVSADVDHECVCGAHPGDD